MSAAILRRDGVAIGGQKAVGIGGPRHSPLAGAVGTDASGFAGEDVRMHQGVGMNGGAEVILQAAREVKRVLGRHIVDALQQRRVTAPANLDPAEQIGLGTSHLEQALRLEGGLGAENLGVRPEADFGAAAVVDLAEVFELAFWVAALEGHAIEFLSARDFDLEPGREGVYDRHADTVKTAGGLIDLGIKFAAGMQRAHDDFERGFFRKFRMRIDRNAAAIVVDRQKSVGAQFHFNEGGVSRQRLVHGVVDDFGEQMMQRLLVGAADIHAGPAAHRLEAFEHLDVPGGVAGLGAGTARCDLEGAALGLGGSEQVVGCF